MPDELEHALREFGDTLDREPSRAQVAEIIDRVPGLAPTAGDLGPRPWRHVLVAAAAGAAIVICGVLLTAPVTAPPGHDLTPTRSPVAGHCAGWTGMVLVPTAQVGVITGWTPPPPATGVLRDVFVRYSQITTGTAVLAVAYYDVDNQQITVERYPRATTVTVERADRTEGVRVGRFPAAWDHPYAIGPASYDLRYRADALDREGDPVTGTVACVGSRLTWTTEDGTTFAVSGQAPSATLLDLARQIAG
ncbi:hypothetical protein [Actinokineospora sp. NBRC 105648]|uniref:hypothetical protein n=1 Tax=Actinokineospora sp. NBRC 105648 TaxID=3032206 RepID=UPI0024A2412B|nr:hypothetical protein [Actinokineospora sp. NBRC 105648]GLZ36405.1 hypothetical protein Acsp05_00300 [Actinokineospora sp. NBRC 105648]